MDCVAVIGLLLVIESIVAQSHQVVIVLHQEAFLEFWQTHAWHLGQSSRTVALDLLLEACKQLVNLLVFVLVVLRSIRSA